MHNSLARLDVYSSLSLSSSRELTFSLHFFQAGLLPNAAALVNKQQFAMTDVALLRLAS